MINERRLPLCLSNAGHRAPWRLLLILTNGQAPTPGTKNGKFTLIGTPVKGRFTVETGIYGLCTSPALVTVTSPLLNSFSLMAAVLSPHVSASPHKMPLPVAEKNSHQASHSDSVGPFQFSAVEVRLSAG